MHHIANVCSSIDSNDPVTSQVIIFLQFNMDIDSSE